MNLGRASRLLVVAAAALVLAACSSTVTRTAGPGSTPKYGATTIVQKGDTLYRIATDNGIAVRDLAAWNGLAPPYTIYPGQRLSLYPAGGRATPSRSTASTTPPRTTTPGRDAGPARTSPPPASAAPVNSGVDWKWPVDGQLLSRFEAGEPTKQGIDIAGTGGAPVRSAADGTVVYSGSGLVGYGELIIIKHNEQWLSAYGHNRTRLVAEGAVVKAGQQIAELGRTGASRDQLHFEIRHNGKPVDPLLHLPRK
ncbi:membrane protein [Lysobacter arseniciresistens ZS79]|uniref:Membrane protein n=1 Tax=Lysobacter arseniciresistens ZS79 TaxID=913325 RepID=A0A0A0F397_9GAMM|nr:peptidoglycan DD-metalloendopeptidase family protein [Lysobacter arseniciresistens]KGM57020.1 membrane protein [Lysobacter arseniciresistens ZS79]